MTGRVIGSICMPLDGGPQAGCRFTPLLSDQERAPDVTPPPAPSWSSLTPH